MLTNDANVYLFDVSRVIVSEGTLWIALPASSTAADSAKAESHATA